MLVISVVNPAGVAPVLLGRLAKCLLSSTLNVYYDTFQVRCSVNGIHDCDYRKVLHTASGPRPEVSLPSLYCFPPTVMAARMKVIRVALREDYITVLLCPSVVLATTNDRPFCGGFLHFPDGLVAGAGLG